MNLAILDNLPASVYGIDFTRRDDPVAFIEDGCDAADQMLHILAWCIVSAQIRGSVGN